MDYCLVVEVPQAGEGYVKKEELLVTGSVLRLRLERKQKPQKINIRRVPRIEQLSIVQQQQDAEDH